jgi:hypothetical protein
MIEDSFAGLNNFIWWFGVVENRLDPLELGRCQIRVFGIHTQDKNSIPTEDLPWAHPIVPFGSSVVKPPTEGTMVFGFYADGKNGRFPVLMGSVPGIPEEILDPSEGFADPLDAATKTNAGYPRPVANSTTTSNASGPRVINDSSKRYPNKLNEPTTSRLARPSRADETGLYLGIRSASIANTSIAIQRRNRVTGVKTSANTRWDEPFPSYNAKYPYNQVVETESGHSLELDDTPKFERVQLSHRVGSTLEFLPSGSVKTKSFNNRYDITMGNHKVYVNGKKEETIQSDCLIRINGKLVIEADGVEIISSGDMNLKGRNVNITSYQDVNIHAGNNLKAGSGKKTSIRGEESLAAFGGLGGISLSTSGAAALQGVASVKISGTQVYAIGLVGWIDTVVTNILPPAITLPTGEPGAATPKRINRAAPVLQKTTPSNRREPTDLYANLQNVIQNTGDA